MNREIKQLWIDALTSGEYEQGYGFLKVRGRDEASFTYCCLGVLCDLAKQAGIVEERAVQPYGGHGSINGYHAPGEMDDYSAYTSELPAEVMEWAGIDTAVGWFSENGTAKIEGHMSLVGMNDSRDWDFVDIARAIDEKF